MLRGMQNQTTMAVDMALGSHSILPATLRTSKASEPGCDITCDPPFFPFAARFLLLASAAVMLFGFFVLICLGHSGFGEYLREGPRFRLPDVKIGT